MKDRTIFVYDSFTSGDTVLLGTLYVDAVRGSESYSFEYDEDWLSNVKLSTIMDPEIMPYTGRQYSSRTRIFGMFADASPDRWGRMLIGRRERLRAEKENRKPRKLYDSDYLLGVYDSSRVGGLRFKTDKSGAFLSDDSEAAVPPWTTLRTLEEASRRFENDESDLSDVWLERLIRPGSSLGGARPKASVVDQSGDLWIAKFPSKHDENDTGAWEKITHDLAVECGINVPEARLERFSDFGSTFLVKRFDRDVDSRIHFASSMTLLGKEDGASAADGTSYLDLAAFIKANGANPKADLEELWRRIVFSMAVNNTDDHLRNHAFILKKSGWILSPMFDVNPVPYGDELSLNVDESNNGISLELALSVAPRFGISPSDAKTTVSDIVGTVTTGWERLARQYGLSRSQIENMRPAFGLD